MINNFEQIKSLLDFSDESRFYFIQIIKRRKDNPGLEKDQKMIKAYYVGSKEYLERHQQEIITTCDMQNARAYIHPNRRSYKRVGMQAIASMFELVRNEDYHAMRRSYDSACGTECSESPRIWILDVDKISQDVIYSDLEFQVLVDDCLLAISNTQPSGDKIVDVLPTKNGVHILSLPFNVMEFSKMLPTGVSIHKDAPTILYIP